MDWHKFTASLRKFAEQVRVNLQVRVNAQVANRTQLRRSQVPGRTQRLHPVAYVCVNTQKYLDTTWLDRALPQILSWHVMLLAVVPRDVCGVTKQPGYVLNRED